MNHREKPTRPKDFPNLSNSIVALLTGLVMLCCSTQSEQQTEDATQEEAARGIDIITNALEIQMPDTLPSGWTTLNYHNNSQMTHFIVFEKYPMYEEKQLTLDDAKKIIVPLFQTIMDSLNTDGPPPYDQLPPWFEKVQFLGGVGLVGPQTTATTTINLQPGYYVVECYVKNPGGQFHSAVGMITSVVIVEESNNLEAPASDVQINISSTKGIEMQGSVAAGAQIFAVNYQDQVVQEHFLGFDVNLVKLETDTDTTALYNWMNWMLPKGLEIPAPAKFLGGAQEMPAGHTAYFTANLTPGRYALISEVPEPQNRGLYVEFEVATK